MNQIPSSAWTFGLRRGAIIGLAALVGVTAYGLSKVSVEVSSAAAGPVNAEGPSVTVPEDQAQAPVQEQVVTGQALVIHHGCGDCHGGVDNPASPAWLSGWQEGFPPDVGKYAVGPFTTWARNLTPDNATGLGRFSERQLFNALRFGLRPGETPDVEITSHTPERATFPRTPSTSP